LAESLGDEIPYWFAEHDGFAYFEAR
jgi:hypothetical protein